jgi:Ca2+-transporting ATPase
MLSFIGGAGLTATIVMLGVMLSLFDGTPTDTPDAMTMVFTGFVVVEFLKRHVVRWAREAPRTPASTIERTVSSNAIGTSGTMTPISGPVHSR